MTTARSLGSFLPGGRNQGGNAAGERHYGAAAADSRRGGPEAHAPGSSERIQARRVAGWTGFRKSLFDSGAAVVATTKIIKLLYVLIPIMTGLAVLAYICPAFSGTPVFGLPLIIGDLLFIVFVMAFRQPRASARRASASTGEIRGE